MSAGRLARSRSSPDGDGTAHYSLDESTDRTHFEAHDALANPVTWSRVEVVAEALELHRTLDAVTLSTSATATLKKQIDGATKETNYTYDHVARLATVSDPLGRATTYAYDAAGNTDQSPHLVRAWLDSGSALYCHGA
jgi:hypothetical protein